MKHNWSIEDDLIALYLYKFDEGTLPYNKKQIALRRNISPGSLNMRIGNFQALDDDGGLTNWAKQSEYVYKKYRNHSEVELRQLVLTALKNE